MFLNFSTKPDDMWRHSTAISSRPLRFRDIRDKADKAIFEITN